MIAPILIIAVGNESRGDDAMGPLLLRQLAELVDPQQVELLEDFQLQIEHAADLAGRELVLFLDAGMNTPAPYIFYRADRDERAAMFSHALTPEALLTTYRQVFLQPPPAAYVLCIRGERFELGAPLSKEARSRMELASGFVRELLPHTAAVPCAKHGLDVPGSQSPTA